ncbi:MAG: VCBS repeat-containing protein, partial [Rhizobiales bacterium]|nr:VCBS repeat-containing protein [Hyphomicrobiales bacterium]
MPQRLTILAFGFILGLQILAAHAQEAGPPTALESSNPQPPVTAYNGSFTQSLPIQVPAFRGLEPKLALSYDSARGIRNIPNAGGWLGAGWSLSGLSAIERISGAVSNDPDHSGGRGSASFGAAGMPADRFALDGEELIACTAAIASAPSCAAGGTHAAFVENYLRIAQNAGANSWTVTARDGTAYTYASVESGVTAATAFRWMLSSTQDRYGNRIEYANVCENAALLDCYVDTIVYKNAGNTADIATIRFYRESRPDVISFATGKGLGRITKRIRSISVRMGPSLVRAYALAYDIGTATGLSRLRSVREYGRDAVIDAAGVISGGSSLPATAFSYSDASKAFAVGPMSCCQPPDPPSYSLGLTMGDFNGDGRTDAAKAIRWNTEGTTYNCRVEVRLGPNLHSYDVPMGGTNNCTGIDILSVADFTGDGADDIALRFTISKASPNPNNPPIITSTRKVYSWNGSTLVAGVNYPEYDTGARIVGQGDFNGDGKAELLFRDGTVLSIAPLWPFTAPSWNAVAPVNQSNLAVADFNGDGRADAIQVWRASDGVRSAIYLSTGSTFLARPVQAWAAFNVDSRAMSFGDVNGDGRADAVLIDDPPDSIPNFRIRSVLSTGMSLDFANAQSVTIGPVDSSVAVSLLGGLFKPLTGDFNGDGRLDVLLPYDSGHPAPIESKYWVVPSIGDAFSPGPYTPNAGWRVDHPMLWGDFNGDGRMDFIVDDVASQRLRYVDGPQPDLLVQIVNPTGGKTTVTYGLSSGTADTKLPFVMHTATSVTYDDNRGWTSQTGLSYEEGSWNSRDRTFMGFRLVTANLPCNTGETVCPKARTTYRQDLASLGKPALIETLSGTTVLRTVTENYTIDTAAPFTSLNTSTLVANTKGAQTKTTKITRVFDNYGNNTNRSDYGDETAAGDERTDTFSFYPNLAHYIVNCRAQEQTFASIGTGGAKLADTSYFYNTNYTFSTPPSVCAALEERGWISGSNYARKRNEYDAFGNLIATNQYPGYPALNDPIRTEYSYDSANALFVTETRQPKYFGTGADARFATQTTWDTVCAAPLTETDINEQVTSYAYDGLCRNTQIVRPLGDYEATDYVGWGTPAQYIQTRRPPAGGQSAERFTRKHLDGFERIWRTASNGRTASTFTYVDTDFTKRGEVARQSQAYYSDTESPQWTGYSYDALDRLTAITNPDASAVGLVHGLGAAGSTIIATVEATDEINRKTLWSLDAAGKVVRREKKRAVSGDPAAVTQYGRDALSRIVSILDPNGNDWAYGYDGLGRRLAVSDPDLGDWSYVYDAAGRLLSQTDAKGQISAMTYDSLGRVLTKTVTGASIPTETTANTYDETRAGYYNVGKLTTATRTVPVNGALPAVAATRRYDHDALGRLVLDTHVGVNGADRALAVEYWPGGEIKRRQLADGSWTGPFTYTLKGELKALDNAATASATEPDWFITDTVYNGRGQVSSISYGNGATAAYGYSAARGWLNAVTAAKSSTTLVSQSYTRNLAGLITAIAGATA